MAHFLPAAGVGDEARVQYKQTFRALDEFMRKYYNEWTFTLDNVNTFSIVLIIFRYIHLLFYTQKRIR